MTYQVQAQTERVSQLDKVKALFLRDGMATYGNVRAHIPGISTKSITRILRQLAREGFLQRGLGRGKHGCVWQVAGRTPEWKPLSRLSSDIYSEDLLIAMRRFVLKTQNASSTVLRHAFGVGDKVCQEVLHHLRREGIVNKSGRNTHWRVIVTLKRARELGISIEDEPIVVRTPSPAVIREPQRANPELGEKLEALSRCVGLVGEESQVGKIFIAIRGDLQRLADQDRIIKQIIRDVS